MPSRRTFLTVLAGPATATLAGCLDANDSTVAQSAQSPTSTEHTIGTPTSTPLPTPEDCSDRHRPTVQASRTAVDPLPYPDLPSALDEERARTFAAAFERAWRHNDALRDRPSVDRISVDVSPEDATAHDSGTGYVVETSATVGYTGTPGSETPTAVAGTSGRLWSRYLVTERFARRVEETNASPAPPTEGTLVACSASPSLVGPPSP